MRIILKPAGLAVALLLLAAVATFVFLRSRPSQPDASLATPEPTISTPEPIAATPAPDALSVTNPADTITPPADASPTPSLPPVDWTNSKRILEPNITGNNWKELITTGSLTHKVVPATVENHPFARQITVGEMGKNAWDLQLAHPLDVAFKKGSRLRLTYWGRSKESCPVLAVIEQAKAPYAKVVSRSTNLTPEWKEYNEEWIQETDTPSGWAEVDFQVGAKVGVVELTGVAIDVIE
jgi:Carbohydrate binding domain